MIKYIGSKRALAPAIVALARALPVSSACDLFAGTTRIGQALRSAGLRVWSNDTATYSEVFGRAYIEADERIDRARMGALLGRLEALPGRHGYFTETFCERARYLQPHNGMRVDAIREAIERLSLSGIERALLLTSLIEAADRVDSTCGLQMAYVKRWSQRSYGDLRLRLPAAVQGPPGIVTRADANALAGELGEIDCVYIDPPYNQHSYFSNYHLWETLVRWDRPEHYGVACKRIDCRKVKSPYNSRRRAWAALGDLIARLPTPWLILSFSDEGFHRPEDLRALLAERGHLAAIAVDNRRYVGAQIGIHDRRGRRVGAVSHLRNRELLFIVGPRRSLVERAAAAAARALAPARLAVAGG
ncbi:MAG TPA: DNA adenine methylase [Solirubrobacteraceae bacterium]|nr:DNA adenine methylase [Solirubrobacteraceae bacterium]